MRITALLSLAALAPGLAAQSNTVSGLDGRLTMISSLTHYGRRGPAYPNGELGMAMLNEMCNPGSVTIPWYQAMQPDHPKFGFLIVRIAGDKIEQINEWSFCKHAFTSVNVNGPCGTCVNPGTGALMGLNCADTYSPGNNSSRVWLGPPQEIDPWLGTWDPVGSYFDIGDPRQAGYPAPADGVRSLSQSVFDSVDNRVTVQEIDFTTPNARYYYGLQLIHQGEALAFRGDNLAHRGFNPTWNGSTWSYPTNVEGQQYGTVLNRWTGATVDFGHNGLDDGRFFVAVKTTPLGGGSYHYEYAVHNVDNSHAGGTFRVPTSSNVTISNITFGDIDSDAGNDWTGARVGNEIVFTAPSGNYLEWNTIYNFGFDADIEPSTSVCQIDEARVGPGNLSVEVPTQVPAVIATVETFGTGCPSSLTAALPCYERNAAGGTLAQTLSSNEQAWQILNPGSVQVASFDVWTSSTGGTVNVPAYLYPNNGLPGLSFGPALAPIATTTMTVGSTPGFYTATFASPVIMNGSYYISFRSPAQNAYLNTLTTGTIVVGHTRSTPVSSWSINVGNASFKVNCAVVPSIGNSGLPALGTSYDLTMADALGGSVAVLISGLSDSTFMGSPLPAALPGAPGCNVLTAPEAVAAALTSPTGTASSPIAVPNSPGLIGLLVYHQWAVLDGAANTLGIVTSNAARARIGN